MECNALNCVSPPQNSYVEALTSNMMAFGNEDCGIQLGLDDIRRVGPS